MEIIRGWKQQLEADLSAYMGGVGRLVSDFTKETGLPVTGICIDFIETTTIGGPAEYVPGNVRVEYGR
jgi:hypothetical protein